MQIFLRAEGGCSVVLQAGSSLNELHTWEQTCPKASYPKGSCWVPNTAENLALRVGTEPWQIQLPSLLKICHHIVNVKRQVFQMGKVRLSPSANSRTTQGIIAQMSNKNSRLSKHHAWTFFDPQIWMLWNRMSMWPAGLEWRVLCNLNYTRRDKVPAIMKKAHLKDRGKPDGKRTQTLSRNFRDFFFFLTLLSIFPKYKSLPIAWC